ncbi:hypothetical protein AB1Y20_010683 [Prymnesium parvum]|uniref:H(+)-exporting diphosphatase n=1 Tax=Prymnesium parvum TaxID=97485 RepID=A0AB34IRG3_PRYPA
MNSSATGTKSEELGFAIASAVLASVVGLWYLLQIVLGSKLVASILTAAIAVAIFVKWTRYENAKREREDAAYIARHTDGTSLQKEDAHAKPKAE